MCVLIFRSHSYFPTQTANDHQSVIGRLVSRSTNSHNGPSWVVMFENHVGTASNKEVLEKDLGEILEKQPAPVIKKAARVKRGSENTKSSEAKQPQKRGLVKMAETTQDRKATDQRPDERFATSSANNGSRDSSDRCSKRGGHKRRKTVTFNHNDQVATDRQPSDSSQQTDSEQNGSSSADMTSARDLRINRRQSGNVKSDPSGKTVGAAAALPVRNGKQRHAAALRMRQKGRFVSNGKGGKSMRGAAVSAANKNVIRVPMLTGTLFLYRGVHRRAEFVRSV